MISSTSSFLKSNHAADCVAAVMSRNKKNKLQMQLVHGTEDQLAGAGGIWVCSQLRCDNGRFCAILPSLLF